MVADMLVGNDEDTKFVNKHSQGMVEQREQAGQILYLNKKLDYRHSVVRLVRRGRPWIGQRQHISEDRRMVREEGPAMDAENYG